MTDEMKEKTERALWSAGVILVTAILWYLYYRLLTAVLFSEYLGVVLLGSLISIILFILLIFITMLLVALFVWIWS